MSSPLPPSSAVRCCVRMPGLEASRSTSTVSRFQIASGGYQEHPWKASNWPCTHPDKLLKLLLMPHPSWHTVRLCSSVRLSLSQPCPLCWVWKPGLVLLIQIKAVSWAVRAAVKMYHPLGETAAGRGLAWSRHCPKWALAAQHTARERHPPRTSARQAG